jgi:hypothetical protein
MRPPIIPQGYIDTSKADNLSWCYDTRGKFAYEYWDAMTIDIATLENIGVWSVVDQYDSIGETHHVIQHLGFQVQMISRWIHQEVQGTILRAR